MKLFDSLTGWFSKLVGKGPTYTWARVDDLPDGLERRTVYLVGDGGQPWSASMMCPCGCGANIALSLLEDDSPSWQATISAESKITLHPSVWRIKGCRSHFVLRNGRVHWARSSTQGS
jgi:Family of unknown function (DUF6527)